MSMYLPNDDVQPTGAEGAEFTEERPELEPDDADEAPDGDRQNDDG